MESCERRNIRNASVYSFSDGCSSAHLFYCKNENERIDDMCSFLYDRDCQTTATDGNGEGLVEWLPQFSALTLLMLLAGCILIRIRED